MHFSFALFFHYLLSSDFAHISKLSISIDVNYNGENRLSTFFSAFRNRDANIGDHLKKALFLGSARVNMLTRGGGGGRARGQKSLQNHFYCNLLYL